MGMDYDGLEVYTPHRPNQEAIKRLADTTDYPTPEVVKVEEVDGLYRLLVNALADDDTVEAAVREFRDCIVFYFDGSTGSGAYMALYLGGEFKGEVWIAHPEALERAAQTYREWKARLKALG